MMEYTPKLFVDFLSKLVAFDKDCCAAANKAFNAIQHRREAEKNEREKVQVTTAEKGKNYLSRVASLLTQTRTQVDDVLSGNFTEKTAIFARLQKCKEALAAVSIAEKSFTNQEDYNAYASSVTAIASETKIDEILQNADNFWRNFFDMVRDVDRALNGTLYQDDDEDVPHVVLGETQKRSICSKFYTLCRSAETVLLREIVSLRKAIVKDIDSLHVAYDDVKKASNEEMASLCSEGLTELKQITKNFTAQMDSSSIKTKESLASTSDQLNRDLTNLSDAFCENFPPQKFSDEYADLYSRESLYQNYTCCSEMPQNMRLGTLQYSLSELGLSDYARALLIRFYPFMYRGNELCIPYCATFNSEFNYLFRFDGQNRQIVVNDACNFGLRLFMMLPPGKLNFTFIDPVTLGESFAMFNRLVEIDDRTSKVINGKVWSTPSDIEDKLKIMTDHISNVTQRCLQGKYENIYEYNRVAEQNAEAYQVLMLMDFPAGLTDQSMRLLEQIVTSGPKCGVFTIIYRNESQYKKISERSHHLIANIEANFQLFNYSDDCETISCPSVTFGKQPLSWHIASMPNDSQKDSIIATLKKGIKNAEKVVIDIDKVNHAETTESTKDGIRIPIGIHGANEFQYLTLGVGGSHHALIAGATGSGKSSLLHTIILRALKQYSPDELSIYLVDFKRGVEFKIYADFVLPSFKVVAIESEREFGYNILLSLEREQKIRADMFKKNNVDKIEEYRDLGKKMPRILVIMDEFHELFSDGNDKLTKDSSIILERIVRQGRAFGIHIILASQSYSNVKGIDRAVFDQMAVRIALKCSKTDADLLLDEGSNEINQISIDDPGRAVYNSEGGNKEFNSHFRVAYIDPKMHRGMLQEISDATKQFADPKNPTRILLSNIENNNYCIFNQFTTYDAASFDTPNRLYIGEPLSVSSSMAMDFQRAEHSNLLMVGKDTEKARSMFVFGMLSLCVNYWIINHHAPETPFVYLFNCKPLEDSYFEDSIQSIAGLLPEYIQYAPVGEMRAIKDMVSTIYHDVKGNAKIGMDKYFFVFGYQRAEDLKGNRLLGDEDFIPNSENAPTASMETMFREILEKGAQRGVHAILWQDDFNALEKERNDVISYFHMRIAFDLKVDEYSRFIGENDVGLMGANSAIYYNRVKDNQKFRPYQTPDGDWLRKICDNLK